MIRVFWAMLLLAGPLGIAQQPQGQGQNLPSSTSPAQTKPSAQPSPSPEPSQDKRETNAQIQADLNSVLSGDPALSGAEVQAAVDDVNIELSGSVQTQAQVERVMALVSPYARDRKIVNKLTLNK